MPAIVADIIKQYDRAANKRYQWDSHWQEIADLVLSTRQFTRKIVPGERRTRKQFDATAVKAVVKLAAALHGLLTNPATQWFSLRARNDSVNQADEAQRWLTDSRNRMLALFASPRFGFNTQIHEAYMDLVAFGTSVMILMEMPDRIRFQTRPLAECYLDEDGDGRVTTVYRKFMPTLSQAVDMFGNALGMERMGEAERNPDNEMTVIHAVYPRTVLAPGRMDGKNKPFASVYVDLDKKLIIREGGFDSFPYLSPRWSKAPGETYGRSPAMDILADIGMVNAMRKTNIVSAEQAVSPPWVVETGGIEGPLRIAPNSIIYRKQGSGAPITPLVTGNRVDLGEAMLDKERRGIQEGFFLDILTLPEIDRMTTVEVVQRIQQRMVFMSPMLSRLVEELLEPIIARTYQAMYNLGMFAPVPEVLGNAPLEVDFVSVMAMSQRASESFNFQQWLGGLGAIAPAAPDVLDNLDTDEAARYSAATWHNVPGRLVRRVEDVTQMRQDRAEERQRQAELAAAQQAGDAAKGFAKAMKDATGATR